MPVQRVVIRCKDLGELREGQPFAVMT
jgi:hypothetical protein